MQYFMQWSTAVVFFIWVLIRVSEKKANSRRKKLEYCSIVSYRHPGLPNDDGLITKSCTDIEHSNIYKDNHQWNLNSNIPIYNNQPTAAFCGMVEFLTLFVVGDVAWSLKFWSYGFWFFLLSFTRLCKWGTVWWKKSA